MSAAIRSFTKASLGLATALLVAACGAAPEQGEEISEESFDFAEQGCSSTFAWDDAYRRIVFTSEFTGADGNKVRYRIYKNTNRTKAVVLFLNGRSEFIEKYDVLFTSLHEYPDGPAPDDETIADLPVTFITVDHEGQGASTEGRVPAHIDDFNFFVQDVDTLFQRIPWLRWHNKPVFIASHSMGGLIASRYAQLNPDKVDGLILGSPMLGFRAPAPGISAEQLAGIAQFYSSVGLDKLCTAPPHPVEPGPIDPLTLGTIAIVNTDPTLKACFDDPSLPQCPYYTECLLMGAPPDCGAPPIDFAGLKMLFQYLYSLPPGCPKWPENCPNPVIGDDAEYCTYTTTHPLQGPQATFGWLYQSYVAQMTFAASGSVDVPTLILSDPNDGVVDATKHSCDLFGQDCSVSAYPGYGHELFTTSLRAGPIGELRNFITTHAGI